MGLRQNKATFLAITVAALGYFVDVYDIALFGIVRVESLKTLGLSGDELLEGGAYLLNMQMLGMLIGGLLWGVLGDKKGRVQVLFGSILLYSLANIANAFVASVSQYAICRLIAGIGLAGEIGAGITLVSELLPKEMRGYGTTIVATVGLMGAVVAGIVGDLFQWQTAYIVGGIMGLVLLFLRVSVAESGLFSSLCEAEHISRGNVSLLFSSWRRFGRYLGCILVGVPIWYAYGILIIFCPEIGQMLGIEEPLRTARAVMFYAVGMTLGDFASGIGSQYFRNRKKVLVTFITMTLLLSVLLLNLPSKSAAVFYWLCLPLGFFLGYWAVYVTTTAEQFGTNLRATVTTSVPNFVRGSTILMTLAFTALKPAFGVVMSASAVGLVAFTLCFISLYFLRETYGVDLNFVEVGEGTVRIGVADSTSASEDKPEKPLPGKQLVGWE